MSAQINLYHPRFLKVHDWLNLNYLALAAVALFSLLGVISLIAHRELAQQQNQVAALHSELETIKAAVEQANELASRPANPQLAAEVNHAQATLNRREEIARLLESGALGSSSGFSAYLLGLARQVPAGLWLTGFTLGAGGSDMEIRGSTFDEKMVPEYIRRLGDEKIFQGRQFSALNLQREPPSNSPTSAASPSATVSPAPTFPADQAKDLKPLRQPLHFVLMPTVAQGGKP